MHRIEVHCHFLPGVDDGCRDVGESLRCLRLMEAAGYSKVFCTPHCGDSGFSDLSTDIVQTLVERLRADVQAAGMGIELKAGGELRLSPTIPADLERNGIPTFGHQKHYVLADIWTRDWPAWATAAVEWLQNKGLTVILAHPERLGYLRSHPAGIEELAKMGLLFQGNLGPIAGADSTDVVALAERFLQDGRYFLLGTDGHNTNHLPTRLKGLERATELVGAEAVREMVERNPARLWG